MTMAIPNLCFCVILWSALATNGLDFSTQGDPFDSQIQGSTEISIRAHNRLRREAATANNDLPKEVDITLDIAGHQLVRALVQNPDVDVNVPVHSEKNGRIVLQDLPREDNTASFLDVQNGSCLLIRKTASGDYQILVGTVLYEGDEYTILPENSRKGRSRNMYNIYKTLEARPYISDYIETGVKERQERKESSAEYKIWQNNATDKLEVELFIVADFAVYSFWYNMTNSSAAPNERDVETKLFLRRHYAFIANGIDLRFKSVADAGFTIAVVFTHLYIADNPSAANWTELDKVNDTVDSLKALNNLRNWTRTSGIPTHDHAMLFSGYDLTRNGDSNNLGVAWLPGICTSYGQSVVEDRGLTTTINVVAAHELGHSVDARHDGDGNSCSIETNNVMAALLGVKNNETLNRNMWIFSSCSLQHFADYIGELDSNNNNNCMRSRSESYNESAILDLGDKQMGQVYPPDEYCRFRENNASYLCRGLYDSNYESICWLLYCSRGNGYCYRNLAGEGTTCGSGKWCEKGHCVSSADAPLVSDETCPFGDQPGVVTTSGFNCSSLIATYPSNCYGSYYKYCCGTCGERYTGIQGCEYGDRYASCNVGHCAIESNLEICCLTCNYTKVISTTTNEATTETTTTATTTTNAAQVSSTFVAETSTVITDTTTPAGADTSTTASQSTITSRITTAEAPSTTKTIKPTDASTSTSPSKHTKTSGITTLTTATTARTRTTINSVELTSTSATTMRMPMETSGSSRTDKATAASTTSGMNPGKTTTLSTGGNDSGKPVVTPFLFLLIMFACILP